MKLRTLATTLCLGALTSLPLMAEDKMEGKVEFNGAIEAMPTTGKHGEWTIGGKKLMVSEQTRFDDTKGKTLAVGQRVEVDAHMVNGQLVASEIEIENEKDKD